MKTGTCLPVARCTSAPRTGAQAANRRSASAGSAAPISYPARGRCHSRTSLSSSPRQPYRSPACPGTPPRPRHPTTNRTPISRASERGQERDLYRWRGLDDKEVLLWHLPRAGYEIGAALPADAERLFAAWAPVRGVLVQRATGKHVPVFIGADHHGAHPDVPRLRDLLAELDPQSAFRVSRLDEFFQAAADG